MMSGVPSYQGEQNGQHSSTGFSAPGAYAGGQYGGPAGAGSTGGAGAVSGYGGGYSGGYAAAGTDGAQEGQGQDQAPGTTSDSHYDGSAPAPGTSSPVKAAAGGEDSKMYTQSASGRKRGRGDDESDPTQTEGGVAAKPQDGHEGADDERPSKLQKASPDDGEGEDQNKTGATDDAPSASNPSSLIANATRGADGKALDATSGIAGIEGGPDPAALIGGSDGTGESGGQVNAGNVSAASAPSSGSGPSGSTGGDGGASGGSGGGPA